MPLGASTFVPAAARPRGVTWLTGEAERATPSGVDGTFDPLRTRVSALLHADAAARSLQTSLLSTAAPQRARQREENGHGRSQAAPEARAVSAAAAGRPPRRPGARAPEPAPGAAEARSERG